MGKVAHVIEGILFLFSILLSALMQKLNILVRLPIRFMVCKKNGHDWVFRGSGLFGMFQSGKRFKCTRCGCATNEAPSKQIKIK